MSITVKANRDGFYGGERRRKGAVFSVESEKEVGRWMDKVDASEAKAEDKSKPKSKPAAKAGEVVRQRPSKSES